MGEDRRYAAVQDATGAHLKRGILEYSWAKNIRLPDVEFRKFEEWAARTDSEEQPIPSLVLSERDFQRLKSQLVDVYGDFERDDYERLEVESLAEIPSDTQSYPTGQGYVYYMPSK